ncbi:hypothetical protein OOT00_00115 [Desulfobotulus sp. H1]|uniref:Uncharacterized protein n=1 Tax=Desulfobotulus pelophilus TaxID=2823377 RepID=A0ABT3N4K7_9BACT|nr:hypothetical protein [Desulfobotulus pelophilus]MCW7752389.1 hypothetical protein [Desulfobotulus pelophilus]
MSIPISSSQIPPPVHNTRNTAPAKSAAEAPVQENHVLQDKTSLSRSSMAAPAAMLPVRLGEEDANMAKIAGFSKAEGLASAHKPISYERVMQLLEG